MTTHRLGQYARWTKMRRQGLSVTEIAERECYSPEHVADVLRDPYARARRRRYWQRLTPLQRATSSFSEAIQPGRLRHVTCPPVLTAAGEKRTDKAA